MPAVVAVAGRDRSARVHKHETAAEVARRGVADVAAPHRRRMPAKGMADAGDGPASNLTLAVPAFGGGHLKIARGLNRRPRSDRPVGTEERNEKSAEDFLLRLFDRRIIFSAHALIAVPASERFSKTKAYYRHIMAVVALRCSRHVQ